MNFSRKLTTEDLKGTVALFRDLMLFFAMDAGSEYQEKVNKNKQLLFRQSYPYAGEPVFKNCFLKLNNHNFRPSKFGVAGGEPCPYCPTLAAWFD